MGFALDAGHLAHVVLGRAGLALGLAQLHVDALDRRVNALDDILVHGLDLVIDALEGHVVTLGRLLQVLALDKQVVVGLDGS